MPNDIANRKISTYKTSIKALSDTPNTDGLTAEDLKALFDGRTDSEVKDSINGIVDDLKSVDGAANIGNAPFYDGGAETIAGQLNELKSEIVNDVVRLTGDQAIEGAKQFKAPVSVPAPTEGGHAANKDYVSEVLTSISAGDMAKAVYDTDGDGVVNAADHASEADHASVADHATESDRASAADHASEADHASVADSLANIHPCNRNLIDNGYFANPVNQRAGRVILSGTRGYYNPQFTGAGDVLDEDYVPLEITDTYGRIQVNIASGLANLYIPIADVKYGYISGGYTIDRWKVYDHGMVVCTENGIRLTDTVDWGTQIENYRVPTNTPVTFSVLTENGIGFVTHSFSGQANERLYRDLGNGITLNALYNWADSGTVLMALQAGAVTVKAVKLELGTKQTLAHEDANGNWVLNEIPNYTEEFIKCQRYFRVFDEIRSNGNSSPYVPVYLNYSDMRAAPNVSLVGRIAGGDDQTLASISFVSAAFSKNSADHIRISANHTGEIKFYGIWLDANL